LICRVCQATGWEWDYVEDTLTLARLGALRRHWAHSPPPHLLLALIAGALAGRPAADPAQQGEWDELKALAADPASGLGIRGKPPS